MKTKNYPHFKLPIKYPIENYKTGATFHLYSVDEHFKTSKKDIEDLVTICNQKAIYNFLFKERLGGKKYTAKDATDFIEFAHNGWKKNSIYIFFIRNNHGKIVGAIDIKKPNLKSVEIGYWASKYEKGFMTNTVIIICDIAKEAGYKSLYGLVDPVNKKSQNVLLRSGFRKHGFIIEKGKKYDKFLKQPDKLSEIMIAPCGMNCALCAAYLRENNKCIGCRRMSEDAPKTCRQCKLRSCDKRKGEYCFDCGSFPCDRLKHLDERYRERYHMSEIDNLKSIEKNGIEKFLANQEKQWKCPTCSGMISCHNGLCYNCDKEKLKNKKRKYTWNK